MLSTVGRAVARRTATARISSSGPQFLSCHAPAVTCSSIAARAFSASAFARLPATKAASEEKTATKTKKKTAAKPMSKPKPKPKSKSKPERRGPKPFPKKEPLTPEQKEKLKILELKRWALIPSNKPKNLPVSPWLIYLKQYVGPGLKDLPGKLQEISGDYQNISPSELEDLKKTADSNRAINEANHRKWVESYPIGRIYLANLTRRQLEQKTSKRIFPIHDHRMPRKPGNGFSLYVKTRYNDADVISVEGTGTKVKFLAKSWNNLSDAEKKSYDTTMREELDQYNAQMDTIRTDARERKAALRDEKLAEKEAALAAEAAAKSAFRAERQAEREQEKALKAAKQAARAKADQ
ncbi:hypothetical protein B0T10DRAFT_474120 [Thelonectria olida]|uniref:HMG box domain-containing protein n=1 Tax=Thelonectria olida TaxID=1576542 RepID=A0A9P9AW69_9HYPO|nr:hypothetical protein B0T10DRAFT_474120 [Thelonectria olida]